MTGQEPKHRDWVKLWVKEALLGTIREDMTPEERGTWYDFLLLAGNSRLPGVICANPETALPIKRIAGILNIQETLVRRCIKKFKESGRITVDKNGVIYISNWSKYQYSDYERQKPYRQKKSLDELNQEYLAAHPEKVMASVEMEGYDTFEVYDGDPDDEPLARGDDTLEEHEEALMNQNPAVRKFKESLE